MNKLKSALLALLLGASITNTQAEEKRGIIYLTTDADMQVLGISQNGKWACGIKVDQTADVSYGFRWNLTTGKVEMLGGVCMAYTVANDGTVAGSHSLKLEDGSSVECGATWKDGEWTYLELPQGSSECWAYAITPDGHAVTGTSYNSTTGYTSYIWTDGKITSTLAAENGASFTYSISPDGQKAGGWAYYNADNRKPVYWDAADSKIHDLNPVSKGSPWQAVKKFTSDGNTMLYWGGYGVDPLREDRGYGIQALYDATTRETRFIYPTYDDPWNFDLFDMNADGTQVVGYQADIDQTEYAVIWDNDTTQYLEYYLRDKGASFEDYNMYQIDSVTHYICRAMAISGDGKTFGVVYYDNSFDYHSMIIELDQVISQLPPVCLEANQLSGLPAVELSWQEPLGDKSTLQGYNIYRDGQKLNSDLLTDLTYFDSGLTMSQTYSYTVSAVYSEGESAQSQQASVTLQELGIQAPRSLMARQRGYQGMVSQWLQPNSNLTPCSYVEGATDFEGFGGGTVSFETGTLYPASMMDLYTGYSLTAVSFYPKCEQGSWIINVYSIKDGVQTLVNSTTVKQQLDYNAWNTVQLSKQIKFQPGASMLIGVQANVTNESYDVMGALMDDYYREYQTDWIRQVGEEEFYTLSDQDESYKIAWAVRALMAPAGVSADIDKVDHYTVLDNGQELTKTSDLSMMENSMSTGSHTIGVQAVYADGRQSEATTTSVDIAPNADVQVGVTPNVRVNFEKINAQWQAPQNLDYTAMGYCSDVCGDLMPTTSESVTQVIARVDYTTKELRSYEGYQVRSLSFLPKADAIFDITLYEDTTVMASLEPDEVSLDQWNTLTLDQPVTIRSGHSYTYVINAYDAPASAVPLATDNADSPANDYSNLYQTAGDEGWYNLDEEIAVSGNWMMRLNLADTKGDDLQVSGYDVVIDGTRQSTKQQGTTYAYDFGTVDSEQHTLRVDTWYPGQMLPAKGTTVNFTLGVDGVTNVQETQNQPLHIYTLDGKQVKHLSRGVNIFHFANGKSKKIMMK